MDYLIHLAILVGIYSILAISLNLVVGFTGLLSITQAAFYGLGAYTTAIILTTTGLNFFVSMLIGILITAVVSLSVGFVLSKFKGDYYALGSFGFNVIVFSIFLNWQDLTRGPLGIPGITRPSAFGFTFSENIYYLILVVAFAGIIYGLSQYITKSSFGRVLQAIREDDKALKVFGYNTLLFKLVIFVIGACFASVAGSLYASYITYVDPSSFTLTESVFILSIIILGGLANNKGAICGAAFLILLPEILRFVGFPTDVAAQLRQAVYGLILILLMMYRPQGLVGKYRI
ncbi:MAG: branched-chain amino acid ABC transporter permease [bacterium]